MKERLFLCNGPMQVLNILTLIEDQGNKNNYNDYLFIYGTFVGKDSSHPIYKAIEELSKFHNWFKVIYSYDDSKFKYDKKELFDLLKCENFHEIYVVRNRGSINKFIINSYESAEIIVYGDSLGTFDSLVNDGVEYYPRIDEVRSIVPIFMTNKFNYLIENLNIKKIDKKFFVSIVNKIVEKGSWDKNSLTGEYTVYLTSYYSKLGWCTLQEEIELYTSHVKDSICLNDKILIKPHPRDTENIARALKNKLTEEGYIVDVLESSILTSYPFELFPAFVKVNNIVTLASTSLMSFNLLYPEIQTKTISAEFFGNKVMNKRLKEYLMDFRNILNQYNNIEYLDGNGFVYGFNSYQEKSDILRNKINTKVQTLCNSVTKEKDIVLLYGAGSYLYEHDILDEFKNSEIDVYGILDSSLEKSGSSFLGLEIMHTSFLEEMLINGTNVRIAITSSFQNQISFYLESLGLKENVDYYKLFYDIHA